MNELNYLKVAEVDIVLDKVSIADYFAAAALLVIKDAEGPNVLREMRYGRVDVRNEREVGDPNLIPNASNYKDSLKARGFENDEIVALASIETFGTHVDPRKADASKYPKLD